MGLVTNEQNNYKCYITGKHLHHRPPPHGSSFLCYENTLLRWLASPTFSKNMKSCKATLKVMNYFNSTTHHIFQNQLCSSRLGTYDEEAGAH